MSGGVLRAVCLTYVLLALLYNALTPVGEAPDETGHFRYVRVIADEGRLPRAADDLWEGHQAPLYYVAQAAWARLIQAASGCRHDPAWLPTRVNPGFPYVVNFNRLVHPGTEYLGRWGCGEWSYHLLRLFSTALTVPLIGLTFGILRAAMPGSPTGVAVGGMLAALLPSHVAISAMLNNDALVNLLVVATTYLVVTACRTGDAVALLRAAALAAVAASAKLSGLYLFGLILAALGLRRDLVPALLARGPARRWLLVAFACGFVPLLVLARNLREWGDLFAVSALERNVAVMAAAGFPRPDTGIVYYYLVELPRVLAGWLLVSYGAVNFPYGGYFELVRWGPLIIVGSVALSLLVRAPWRQVEKQPLILLGVGLVLFFATYAYPGYRYRWLQVRYFFSQLPFLCLCASVGLLTLWAGVRRAGPRLPDRLLIALTYACLVALNLLVLAEGVVGHLYRYIGAPG